MTLKEYWQKASSFAVYKNDYRWDFLRIGRIGEIGELAEKLKKIMRGDYPGLDFNTPNNWDEETKRSIILELGDVSWYCIMSTHEETLSVLDKMELKPTIHKDIYKTVIDMAATQKISEIFCYVGGIAQLLGYTLDDVLRMNIEKLTLRMEKQKLRGNGDYRERL